MHFMHLLLTAFSWGSLFILVKYGMNSFHAYDLTALRFVICAIILLPFLPKALNYAKGENFAPMMTVAVIGSGLPVLFLTIGQTQLSSAATGIINALTPIASMVVGVIFFGIMVMRGQVVGILLGFTGCFLLVLTRNGLDGNNHLFPALLMVCATICYGWSANTLKRDLTLVSSLHITTFTFFINGLAGLVYLAAFSDLTVYADDPHIIQSLYALLALSLGAVVSVVMYNRLIQVKGPLYATMVTYLMPVVSIFWGWADGEAINEQYFWSLAIILSGVFMATTFPHLLSKKERVA